MSLFEALHGRSCLTPLNWSEPVEKVIVGSDLVREAKAKVRIIQTNLRIAQDWQEKYADKRRRPLSFSENDFIYLRASPMKGIQRFGVKVKLVPRYIGSFKIRERCGLVAYKLELPASLSGIHNIFYVLQLKWCLKPPIDVILEEYEQLHPALTYSEDPIKLNTRWERTSNQQENTEIL